MTSTLSAREVRNLVAETFREFGAKDLSCMVENLLVREGRCFGRSYAVAGLMAMWMVDVGLLVFYDDAGTILRTVNLLEELESPRMAA